MAKDINENKITMCRSYLGRELKSTAIYDTEAESWTIRALCIGGFQERYETTEGGLNHLIELHSRWIAWVHTMPVVNRVFEPEINFNSPEI